MSESNSLYDYLSPAIDRDTKPIIKDIIESFESLTKLNDWRPKGIDRLILIEILKIGLPLFYLSNFDSFNDFRKKLSLNILNKSEPSASDLSELNAAALCIKLGAKFIEKIKESKNKRQDLKAEFPSGEIAEIEVTCASKKQIHMEREKVARELCNKIMEINQRHHIILHSVNPPSIDEELEIIESIKTMKTGTVIQKEGQWHLRSEDKKKELIRTAEDKPKWWPKGVYNIACASRIIGGNKNKKITPQNHIDLSVPLLKYLNPVRNKADRPQGSGNNQFIVALDINNLMGAFKKFRDELPKYFNTWHHISGILLFKTWIDFNLVHASWECEFISNPNASYPPSKEFNQIKEKDGKPQLIGIPLKG